MKKKKDFESPKEAFLYFILGGASQYGLYWGVNYVMNICSIIGESYSSGGKILSVILFPIAVCIAIVGIMVFPYFWLRILEYVFKFISSLPQIIRNEFDVLKRIRNNSGFSKFKAFGGFLFYFRLRQRVLAYFLAFLSVGIFTWYFAFRQHDYEKTYWKINFYYNEPIPEFIFKENVSYTFESSADLYSIWLEGNEYIVSKHLDLNDKPNVLSLMFPNKWNIKLPWDTRVKFVFYQDHINEIFSQSFEVWANKEEGLKVTYNDFVLERVKKYPRTKRYIRN